MTVHFGPEYAIPDFFMDTSVNTLAQRGLSFTQLRLPSAYESFGREPEEP